MRATADNQRWARAAMATALVAGCTLLAGCAGGAVAGQAAPVDAASAAGGPGADGTGAAASSPDTTSPDTTSPDPAGLDSASRGAIAPDGSNPSGAGDGGRAIAADAAADGTAAGVATKPCPDGQFQSQAGAPCEPATCAAMLLAVQDAIANLVAGARACQADADCTVVPTTTACQGTSGVAIAKAQQAQLEALVGWLDIHICEAQQFAAQCGYSTPKCMAPKPVCVQGLCAYQPP